MARILSLCFLLAGQLTAQSGRSNVEDRLLRLLLASDCFMSGLTRSSSHLGRACSAYDDCTVSSASQFMMHAG